MQTANVNKRFTTFPTIIKHEKHTIDNRAKISGTSDEFLWSQFLGPLMNSFALSKKFKDNGSTSHDKVHKNAINQNEKP